MLFGGNVLVIPFPHFNRLVAEHQLDIALVVYLVIFINRGHEAVGRGKDVVPGQ